MAAGAGDTQFAAGTIAFALTIMLLLSFCINVFCPSVAVDADRQELLDEYTEYTGMSADTTTVTWVLTGIYEPYNGGAYGYTSDGWLYGAMIRNDYTPSQYSGTTQSYKVSWDSASNLYRYSADSADYSASSGTGHAEGDIYTSVTFDVNEKSSIFFTEKMKHTDGDYFYYDYTGYRYAFQSPANYYQKDADGNKIEVASNTSSLSLIWYQYYSVGSGISGQLILSGSDSGTAYINSAQIIQAYNSSTSAASFDMVFNGVKMTVWIKMDPYMLANGMTIKDCYDNGYWSVMVTSQSTSSETYISADYAMNPANLLSTIIHILTFNYEDYGISDTLGFVCSVVVVVPLYAGMIGIFSRDIWMAIIGMGILAAIQSIGFFALRRGQAHAQRKEMGKMTSGSKRKGMGTKAMAALVVLAMCLTAVPMVGQDSDADSTPAGSVYGMGQNNYGQLGQGDTTSPVTSPVQVGADKGTIASVDAEGSMAYFITTDGKLYGMGVNTNGQLGQGDTTSPVTSPVQIGSYTGVTAVVFNGYTTYFIADGKLYGMGQNNYGQLGQGDTTSPVTSPVQIGADKGTIASVAIAGYDDVKAYFITTDGKLYGMGQNNYGQLGQGDTTSPVTSPVQIGANLGAIASVVAGKDTAYFITTDGKLYGMGQNNYGQLGQGDTSTKSTPVQIGADKGTIANVTTNGYETYFITTDGKLYGMGRNNYGQLGQGSTTIIGGIKSPVQIGADKGTIASVDAGGGAAYFITTDGNLYGMGQNNYGQLGQGDTTSPVTSPVQIGADKGTIASVDAEGSVAYFITTDGNLYGMGVNTDGQLGQGDTTSPVTSPVQIGANLGAIASFATNGASTLMITGVMLSATSSNASYGTVSRSVTHVDPNTTYTVSGSTVTVNADTPAVFSASPAESTAQYAYAFSRWQDSDGNDVADGTYTLTANTELTAVFTRLLLQYDITWSIDGTDTTESYDYGSTPTHADPAKDGCVFLGWEPSITAVTGDATYTASFASVAVTVTASGRVYADGGTYTLTASIEPPLEVSAWSWAVTAPDGTAYTADGATLTLTTADGATGTVSVTATATYSGTDYSGTASLAIQPESRKQIDGIVGVIPAVLAVALIVGVASMVAVGRSNGGLDPKTIVSGIVGASVCAVVLAVLVPVIGGL